MGEKKKSRQSLQHLFTNPDNHYNFELFYKYLTETESHSNFILCKGKADERDQILNFFRRDSLAKRIFFFDLTDPVTDTIELQERIASVHEKTGNIKDIFFIYNMENCIEVLATGERDYFEKLNMIRDFFMRYNSVFIFFMTEELVKVMIKYAFDFYDWIKLTFTFIPEKGAITDFELRVLETFVREHPRQYYSDTANKINYLEKELTKINEPPRKLPILLELGKLYYQTMHYDEALKYSLEAMDILEASPIKRDLGPIEAYLSLAQIFSKLGDMDKALKYQKKAEDFIKRNSG